MKEIREMFNISYFDKEELSLEKHCDTYFEIENDILDVLRKYDIDFVLVETEAIKDLRKQNTELKDNWNKLKEWLEEIINKNKKLDLPDRYEMYVLGKVIDKMQEIEGGMNE